MLLFSRAVSAPSLGNTFHSAVQAGVQTRRVSRQSPRQRTRGARGNTTPHLDTSSSGVWHLLWRLGWATWQNNLRSWTQGQIIADEIVPLVCAQVAAGLPSVGSSRPMDFYFQMDFFPKMLKQGYFSHLLWWKQSQVPLQAKAEGDWVLSSIGTAGEGLKRNTGAS